MYDDLTERLIKAFLPVLIFFVVISFCVGGLIGYFIK